MPMMILQFQILNTTDEEQDQVKEFCYWLCSVLYSKIDTKINRRKISLRINYILEQVTWVKWNSDKYNLSVSAIMRAIRDSIDIEQQRDNMWKIQINPNILIPYSNTSIDRLIRFINYGDNKQRATGMFTNLEREFNHKELNSMWQLFILRNLGSMSQAKIISR